MDNRFADGVAAMVTYGLVAVILAALAFGAALGFGIPKGIGWLRDHVEISWEASDGR